MIIIMGIKMVMVTRTRAPSWNHPMSKQLTRVRAMRKQRVTTVGIQSVNFGSAPRRIKYFIKIGTNLIKLKR